MKHLVIRNLGPLHQADVHLNRVNLVIGIQGSGKSCLLRAACFCSWVEKRIMLMQSTEYFMHDNRFIEDFLGYYNMSAYLKPDTFIYYETTCVKFYYDNSREKDKFIYEPQSNSWRYARPKVSYLPSERNVVSMFMDYKQLPNAGSYIQEFMSEWDLARRAYKQKDDLGLGVSYHYEKKQGGKDMVMLNSGKDIELSETSSGMQSVLPLMVCLNYLGKEVFVNSTDRITQNITLDKQEEIRNAFDIIYHRCLSVGKTDEKCTTTINLNSKPFTYRFNSKKDKQKFDGYVNRLLTTDHSELFLEEPENNLFPTTQCQLVNVLLDSFVNGKKDNVLFITTHSPYIFEQMLKYRGKDFSLFVTRGVSDTDEFEIKTVHEEGIRDIRANGVDLFLNIELDV